MRPLEHYFEVFGPEAGEVKARCATWDEAAKAADTYAQDGKEYLVYECRVVHRTSRAQSSTK